MQMEIDMMDILKRIRKMEKEFINLFVEINISEIIKIV
jgi:hypothetical protein